MKCPVCHLPDSRVMDSRPIDDGNSIRRRRECPSCGKRLTTYEVIDTEPIAVIKRDGRREIFDKHKLALGIQRACQKRDVNAEKIAASIESELQSSVVTEISSTDIGELVLTRLKETDMISYIRFASVYREFKDIDSFMDEIQSLYRRSRRRVQDKTEDKSND